MRFQVASQQGIGGIFSGDTLVLYSRKMLQGRPQRCQAANLKFSDLTGATGLMGTEFAGNELTGNVFENATQDLKAHFDLL